MSTSTKFTKLLTATLLILICNIKSSQTRSHVKSTQHSSQAPIQPEIYLTSYREADSFQRTAANKNFKNLHQFSNDFLSKSGNIWIVSAETREVTFTCEYYAPVKWVFPDESQIFSQKYFQIDSTENRDTTFNPVSQRPCALAFRINLRINFAALDFFSTNITCSSETTYAHSQSSIHVFLQGKKPIEREGETVELSVPRALQMNVPPLLIPCRPSSPNISVFIEKKYRTLIKLPRVHHKLMRRLPEWQTMPIGKDISFDPKYGFTLNRNFLRDRVFGLYRCSVYSDDGNADPIAPIISGAGQDFANFVYFNVTMQPANEEIVPEPPFTPKKQMFGQASVTIAQIYAVDTHHHINNQWWTVTCCSGINNKPPKLYARFCQSPLRCQLLGEKLVENVEKDLHGHQLDMMLKKGTLVENTTDCVRNYLFGSSEMVVCQGENVDFAQQYFRVFHPLAGTPVANRSKVIEAAENAESFQVPGWSEEKPKYTSLTTYDELDNLSPKSKKMLILFGRMFTPNKLIQHSPIGPSIIFRNKTETRASLLMHLQDAKYVDKLEKIVEYDREILYEGEPLVTMCFGLSMFYSEGPLLRINWKNGSKSVVQSADEVDNIQTKVLFLGGNANMAYGYASGLVVIFGESVVAHPNMSSVDCWMPIRNQDGFDQMSRNLKVEPSILPEFKEEIKETVYFYLGEKNKVITCTVKKAAPYPKMTVLVDGRERKPEWSESRKEKKNKKNGDEAENVLTVNISYEPVHHGHQGVVKCIAENVNGTVVRTINVFVIEKPRIELPICLGILGLLCVVLIGLAAYHWRTQRVMQLLRTIAT